jgi:putative peptidoglycan lipid II flippase
MKTRQESNLPVAAPEESKSRPSAARLSAKTSVSITMMLLLGGFLEVIKNSAIAYRYGSGVQTDKFFTAYMVPSAYSMFWVSSCLSGLVPVLTVWQKDQPQKFATTVGSVLLLSTTLMAALGGLGFAAAPVVIRFLVPGFSPADRGETATLFRILTPLFVLVGFTGVVIAVLNCHRKFLFAASNKLFVNIFVLTGLFIGFATLKIDWLAWLIIGGSLAYAGFLCFELWRSVQPRFAWTLDRRQSQMLLAALVMPFLAYVLRQSSLLGEKVIASFLPTGSISALTYCFQAIGGLGAVILGGVTMAQMPMFARQDSIAGKLSLLWQGSYYLLVVTLPLAWGGYLLARPLVFVLFRHGVFTTSAAMEATQVFKGYAFTIFFSALAVQFQTPFWAERRYGTLVWNNTLIALLNIALDLLLVPYWGVVGIALGFTLSSAISCLRMGWLVRRHYGALFPRGSLPCALKALAASLAMALVVFLARRPVSGLVLARVSDFYQEIFRVLVLATLGMATYAASGLIQGMEPFGALYRGVWGRLRRSREP